MEKLYAEKKVKTASGEILYHRREIFDVEPEEDHEALKALFEDELLPGERFVIDEKPPEW